MMLKTGREVLTRPMDNGATEAFFADGSPMTSAEWAEYCDRLTAPARRDRELATHYLEDRWADQRARFPWNDTSQANKRMVVKANLPHVLRNKTRMNRLRTTPRADWLR